MTPEPEPKRIQRKRTKGWRMPSDAVYVGRPTIWGNPFEVVPSRTHRGDWIVVTRSIGPDGWVYDDWGHYLDRDGARAGAVILFETHIGAFGNYEYDADRLRLLLALAGRDFACWCPLDAPCHADVLLEIANSAPVAANFDVSEALR